MKKHRKSIAMTYGKREKTSYMTRHKQKNDLRNRQQMRLGSSAGNGWKEQQISDRRDKIIEVFAREKEVTRMRIEDESIQTQFYRDDYLDLEMMWNKKIHQIQEETFKIRQNNQQEIKIIRTLELDLEKKKNRIQELQVSIQETARKYQVPALEEEEQQTQNHYKELIKIIQDSEKQIAALKADRLELWAHNTKLLQSIQTIKNSIQKAEAQDHDISQNSLQAATPKIQSLLAQIQSLEYQNNKLQQKLNTRQDELEMGQQDSVRNLDLAQKVLMIKQLDKFQQLMLVKQNELRRGEQFQRNKQFVKAKQKEVQVLQKQIKKKEAIIQQLTEEIKQKSIDMLLLYQY